MKNASVMLILSLFVMPALAAQQNNSKTMVSAGDCNGRLSGPMAKNVKVTVLEKRSGPRIYSVSPTGQFMIKASQDNQGLALIVDLHTNEVVEEVDTKGWEWTTIQWRHDGLSFAYKKYDYLDDGKLVIYQIKKKPKGPSLKAISRLSKGNWRKGGNWILSKHDGEGLRVIDASTGEVQTAIKGVSSFVWHPTNPVFFYTDRKKRLFSYNLSTQKITKLSSASNGSLSQLKTLVPGGATNPLDDHLKGKPLVPGESKSRALQEQVGSSELVNVLGQKLEIDVEGNHSLAVKPTRQYSLLPALQKDYERAAPGNIKLHEMDSEGRFLVTTQLTGREWEISRDLTDYERAERKASPFNMYDRYRTHTVSEVELKILDLENNREFKHLFNHTARLNRHGSSPAPDSLNLIWTDEQSFMMGHDYDSSFVGLIWSLDESSQPNVVRKEILHFNSLVKEKSIAPSVFITNDDSKVLMSLVDGMVKFRAIGSQLPFSDFEFPVTALIDRGLQFSDETMLELLGVTGAGALILNLMEAGIGGSTSHIVKIEFLSTILSREQ